jgi:hypothetical protein
VLGATSQRARAAADALANHGGSPPARLVEPARPNDALTSPAAIAPGAVPQSDALRASLPGAAPVQFGAPQSAQGFVPIGPPGRAAAPGPGEPGAAPERTLSAPGAADPARSGPGPGFTPIEGGPARAGGESAAPAGVAAPVGGFGQIPAAVSGGAPVPAPATATPTATPTAVPTGERPAAGVMAPEGTFLPLVPSSGSPRATATASQPSPP